MESIGDEPQIPPGRHHSPLRSIRKTGNHPPRIGPPAIVWSWSISRPQTPRPNILKGRPSPRPGRAEAEQEPLGGASAG